MASYTTFEEKLVELKKVEETPQISRPKIQRVAKYLRNRTNHEKHYSPKFVSIGPIHHDNANLKSGEKYKLMWAAKYIKNTSQTPENLLKKIVDNIDELKGLFADDVLTLTGESLNGFHSLEEKLSWMLFVDGCSLLYILEEADIADPQRMNIKVNQLVHVMMDVFLLENQLPYLVLKLLCKNDSETELIYTVKTFLRYVHWTQPDSIQECCFGVRNRKYKKKEEYSVEVLIQNESDSELPIHLLDLQRNIMLTKTKGNVENNKKQRRKKSYEETLITYRNIQDLRAVGIRLKSSKTPMPSDIDFSKGWFAATLTLPLLFVDDTTATFYLNLIAYEMCPDFENDYGVSSFAYFMDSLIDHPEDVKELRSSGILLNSLGTDEEVANLFNIIGADLVPDIEIYYEIRSKMNDHYRNTCKTWIALGIHTYFSNPWAFTAFLAAFTALTLTFIQTWFAIHPTH